MTDNEFNASPYWSEKIKSVFACPPVEVVEYFDQNGYDLTKLEQLSDDMFSTLRSLTRDLTPST